MDMLYIWFLISTRFNEVKLVRSPTPGHRRFWQNDDVGEILSVSLYYVEMLVNPVVQYHGGSIMASVQTWTVDEKPLK